MNDPLFSVVDQVVLVSGASRGIGWAIAQGFASRGARVIVTGREASTLSAAAVALSQHGPAVLPLVCDVAKPADVRRLADDAVRAFGRIDTLINVAGVNRRKPAEDVTEKDFDFVMDVNFKGAFMLSQAVGRQMLEQGGGNQINVVSLNNFAPLKWVLPYAASKAALAHMTRSLAMEWGDRGIRVNAIAPGFILTDLTRKLWSSPVMQEWGRRGTPQRRLGLPEDLVGTAIFLASPASSFMTGQVLYVDGGFSAGIEWPISEAGRKEG
jgi:NAD(P)-dependent dehydrogenase (short-subunit alcohol dehydrogenase family)